MNSNRISTSLALCIVAVLASGCQSSPPPTGGGEAALQEGAAEEPAAPAHEGPPVCTQVGLDSLQTWLVEEGFTGPKAEVLIARGLLRDEVCPEIDADIRAILEAHAEPRTLNAKNDALIEAAQRQLDARCDKVFLMRAQTLTEQFTACFGTDSPLASPAEVDAASSAVISGGLVYLWMTEGGSSPELSRAIIRRFAAIEPPASPAE